MEQSHELPIFARGCRPADLADHFGSNELMDTVGFLIESGTSVRWHCVICERSSLADLTAVQKARGAAYDLTDKTPRCQQPGCLGRVWFSVRSGSWMRKLLTSEGERRLEAHGDWVFAERSRLRKALTQKTAATGGMTTAKWGGNIKSEAAQSAGPPPLHPAMRGISVRGGDRFQKQISLPI